MASRSRTTPAHSRTAVQPSNQKTSKIPSSSSRTMGGNYVYGPPPSSSGKKRKREYVDLTHDSEEQPAGKPKGANSQSSPSKPRSKKVKDEEKRLKRFRSHPPGSYVERLDRVRSQRMFLIDRERKTGNDGTQEEVFDLAGSTGNIYTVTIGKLPKCTCPDNEKGNQCKHIIYILVNVLKAPNDLSYQLAFLSTELATIFANAPPSPQSSSSSGEETENTNGNRKPVEGDCPVCVMPMEEDEPIVWCKAACGNNLHKTCFEQWARSKPGQTKCVYCRTPWQEDPADVGSLKNIRKTGQGRIGSDGYVNVAAELGISGERDTSSYHSYWLNRRRGYYH